MTGTQRAGGTSSGRTTQAPEGAPTGGRGASLTERRKAETRMEIARTAARLFMANGPRATRAEDIARASGVAPRTFYRYFATKEEALAPLLTAGAHRWAEAVRDAPADLTVGEALRHAAVRTFGTGMPAASLEWVRTLVHLVHSDPALTKVWAEICRAAEQELAEVLAERVAAGPAARVRPGGEAFAGVTPDLRLAAAVAGAAIRVAVESWAAGDEPANDPHGLAGHALGNLDALRDFGWESQSRPGPERD
ncbi:TetR family transcriptional regulator [Streptomyces caeni]|uniref:TetR family transcriptional regulator n=1 Tax=Streptomyces caeni TaxID=2307231 RepID=A0ABW4J2J0_9ACTN